MISLNTLWKLSNYRIHCHFPEYFISFYFECSCVFTFPSFSVLYKSGFIYLQLFPVVSWWSVAKRIKSLTVWQLFSPNYLCIFFPPLTCHMLNKHDSSQGKCHGKQQQPLLSLSGLWKRIFQQHVKFKSRTDKTWTLIRDWLRGQVFLCLNLLSLKYYWTTPVFFCCVSNSKSLKVHLMRQTLISSFYFSQYLRLVVLRSYLYLQ